LLVMTLLFGGLLALPLGIIAANGRRLFRLPVMGYITFFRGTPWCEYWGRLAGVSYADAQDAVPRRWA